MRLREASPHHDVPDQVLVHAQFDSHDVDKSNLCEEPHALVGVPHVEEAQDEGCSVPDSVCVMSDQSFSVESH